MPLFNKTYTYKSQIGYYDGEGIWYDEPTESTFQGSVQPLTSKEVDNLDIGKKVTGGVKIYSGTKLPTASVEGEEKGAIVIFQDKEYEVIYEDEFQSGIIPHYKYRAVYRELIREEESA